MLQNLTTISSPTDRVVTVDDLKAHCRIDTTAEDGLLGDYLDSAEGYAAKMRGEQFLTAQYRLDLASPQAVDDWNFAGGQLYKSTTRIREIFGFAADVVAFVFLPLPPMQAVNSVQYYDANNVLQTMSPGIWRVTGKRPAAVVFTNQFPTLYDREDALRITFTTGWGDDASDVPGNIKHAVRLMGADQWKNRENTTDTTIVDRLLRLDRWSGM